MRFIAALAISTALAAGACNAATLSVDTLPAGFFGSTVAVVPEATITSFGTDLFFGNASFAAPGSFCAINGANCNADLQIDFNNVVSDMFFRVSGFDTGDFVALGVYGIGDALLGTVDLTSDIFSLDLSGFGSITRLYFDDSSTGAGLAYSEFSFTQVPAPAALPLLVGAIALLVGVRRSRMV